jgi:hypothetical protein
VSKRKLLPKPKRKPKVRSRAAKRKLVNKLIAPPWPRSNREVAEAIATKYFPRRKLEKIIEVIVEAVVEGRKIERGRIAMTLMYHDASTATATRPR